MAKYDIVILVSVRAHFTIATDSKEAAEEAAHEIAANDIFETHGRIECKGVPLELDNAEIESIEEQDANI